MKYPIPEVDQPPRAKPPSVDESDETREPTAMEAVRVAGAAVLDPCARWERSGREIPSLPLWVRTTMKTQLDPADWRTGFLAVHERPIPLDLQADLHENVPQAFLRDLFRPVRQFFVTPEEIEGTRLIGRWMDGFEEVRAARVIEPVPTVEPAFEWVRDAQARRREFLDEDWKAWLPDEAPRREMRQPNAEAISGLFAEQDERAFPSRRDDET